MARSSGLPVARRPRPPVGGRPAHAARRRRRDPLRPRPPADRPQEGRARGLARGPPRRPTGAGFRSTATMMYGHVEEAGRRAGPPRRRPRPPGRDGGFTAFVPWSFKPGNTLLENGSSTTRAPTPTSGCSPLARCYLDNFASRPGLVVLRGQEGRPDRPPLRRRRLGRDPVRGERPPGGGLREQDHRGRDADADPRRPASGRSSGRRSTSGSEGLLRAAAASARPPRSGQSAQPTVGRGRGRRLLREGRCGGMAREEAAPRRPPGRAVSRACRPSAPSVTV